MPKIIPQDYEKEFIKQEGSRKHIFFMSKRKSIRKEGLKARIMDYFYGGEAFIKEILMEDHVWGKYYGCVKIVPEVIGCYMEMEVFYEREREGRIFQVDRHINWKKLRSHQYK